MYACPPPLRESPYSEDSFLSLDENSETQFKNEITAFIKHPDRFEESLNKIKRIRQILSQPFHENNILEETLVPIFICNDEQQCDPHYFYRGQIFYKKIQNTFKIVAQGYGTRFCPEQNEVLTGLWHLNAYMGHSYPQYKTLPSVSGILKRNGIIYEGRFADLINNTGEGYTYQLLGEGSRPEKSQWIEGKIINITKWKIGEEISKKTVVDSK